LFYIFNLIKALVVKNSTPCLFNFKLKKIQQNYLIKIKKIKNYTINNFLLKFIFKKSTFGKSKMLYEVIKTLLKLFLFVLKYLKLLKSNKKTNKLKYSANYNKLKNKIIISKFPTLIKKTTKTKKFKQKNLKKMNNLVVFIYTLHLNSTIFNAKVCKLNKVFIFSNLFFIINSTIENSLNV
jgi:hypothetical protein